MPTGNTRKKATTKPAQAKVEPEVTENTVDEITDTVEVKKETVKAVASKTYSDDDFIRCRSIIQGKYIQGGKKTGAVYVFYGYGDETDIQYSDLRTMKLSRDSAIYLPMIVIEDETLLATKEWADVKELYDSMYTTDDIAQILNLPLAKFREILEQAPTGLKNAIKIEVSDGYSNGTFDSINKIKAVEEICDVEIINLA